MNSFLVLRLALEIGPTWTHINYVDIEIGSKINVRLPTIEKYTACKKIQRIESYVQAHARLRDYYDCVLDALSAQERIIQILSVYASSPNLNQGVHLEEEREISFRDGESQPCSDVVSDTLEGAVARQPRIATNRIQRNGSNAVHSLERLLIELEHHCLSDTQDRSDVVVSYRSATLRMSAVYIRREALHHSFAVLIGIGDVQCKRLDCILAILSTNDAIGCEIKCGCSDFIEDGMCEHKDLLTKDRDILIRTIRILGRFDKETSSKGISCFEESAVSCKANDDFAS